MTLPYVLEHKHFQNQHGKQNQNLSGNPIYQELKSFVIMLTNFVFTPTELLQLDDFAASYQILQNETYNLNISIQSQVANYT